MKEQVSTRPLMIIVATDAPLSDRNLTRLAKRAILGIGRTSGNMSNGSGDYVLAFSTAPDVHRSRARRRATSQITELPNHRMTSLFSAVIEATEEAVYNALIAAESVKGRNGKVYEKLPVQTVLGILKEHRRLQ
jgi:D-aminopeptidase